MKRWIIVVAVLAGCQPAAPPRESSSSGIAPANTNAAPLEEPPAVTAKSPALLPSPPKAELSIAWDCGLESKEKAALGEWERKVLRAPEDGATLSVKAARATKLRLNLSGLSKVRGGRILVSLDHFAPRVARAEMTVGSLLTEWDELGPGTHRLVSLWVDGSGLPILSEDGQPLVEQRRFHVEREGALPLAGWLLLAPAGTLNATEAGSGGQSGFPHGLSLLRLAGESDATPLALQVREANAVKEGRLSAGHCRLRGVESGDYHFRLSDETGASFERVMTVNLDLGRAPGAE